MNQYLERMIFPRIRDNLLNQSRFDLQRDQINELVCVADAYPEAEVLWLRGGFPTSFLLFLSFHSSFSLSNSASDLSVLAQNSSRTILKFDHELHGVNTYICEAKNKHGLTRIFITVLIPGGFHQPCGMKKQQGKNHAIDLDNQSKPILSSSEIQSRSVLLSWRVSNGRYDRFNHFIIYYRRLHNAEELRTDRTHPIHIEDYKQVLVDPRTIQFSFSFRVNTSPSIDRNTTKLFSA